jgi:hypothetical protein
MSALAKASVRQNPSVEANAAQGLGHGQIRATSAFNSPSSASSLVAHGPCLLHSPLPCPAMPPATTFNTMRSPQQPWPSFSLMMLQAYPALAPLLFPPANAEEGYDDDTRSWTTDGFEVESRLSQGDDDLMVGVALRMEDHAANALSR